MDVGAAAGLQEPAVGPGGEAAVGDPHDTAQAPVPHVLVDLAIRAESAVLPGQHQTRTGMRSRVTARPMTICGRSSQGS